MTQPSPSEAHLAELYEQYYVPKEYVAPERSSIDARVVGLRAGDPALPAQWKWERSTEIPALFLQEPTAAYFASCRSVLDVGAYTGENMLWLEAAGWSPLGVEPNPKAVAVGRRIGLDVREGELADCNLASASLDAAYLSYVIEHVADPGALLQELHRVLRPGGRLLLTTHNVRSIWRYLFGPYWIHWHTPFHLYHSHPRALRWLAERSGFSTLYLATRTPTFWLLMSLRAARDSVRGRAPHKRLYRPLTLEVASRVHRLLKLERTTGQGDCIIAIFERR